MPDSDEQAQPLMSLAPEVIESGHDDVLPLDPRFPNRKNPAEIILPDWIYIRDRSGRYLAERSSGPGHSALSFRSGDPDLYCVFQATGGPFRYHLFARQSGKSIIRYYNDWYSTGDPTGSLPSYNPVSYAGNYVYFRDNYGPPMFLSSDENGSGSPVPPGYLNDSSQFDTIRNHPGLDDERDNQRSIQDYPVNGDRRFSCCRPQHVTGPQRLRRHYQRDAHLYLRKMVRRYLEQRRRPRHWGEYSFKAGVPFFADGKYEISVSPSSSHNWGGHEGTREVVTSSMVVNVPPKKKARATIIVRNAKLAVPFSYTQGIQWSDSIGAEIPKEGIYNNVDSWHVDVVLDNWEDV